MSQSNSPPSSCRILSIQSHVAFGYVGGKAAVFPLQCLGYDVDVVNTVNFSNHAAYHRSGGSKATAQELEAIFDGMEQNELLIPQRLLTGYTASAESLEAVFQLAKKLRARIPDLIYLLDPVLGDAGRLYVSPDTIPIYRSMLPLATIITPNWFEIETLTGIQLQDLNSLRAALRSLHEEYRVQNVVISSIPLSTWLNDSLPLHLRPTNSDSHLLCLASEGSSEEHPSHVYALALPTYPGYFTGVGDLFSAMVLGHYHPSSAAATPGVTSESVNHQLTPLSRTVSMALAKTQALIKLTHEHSMELPEGERYPTDDERDADEPRRRTRRMRGRELRIIQGQNVFRNLTLESEGVKTMKIWEGFW